MTVTNWVEFFLALSVFSLFVAFFFARQVIGSDPGTPAMLQMAGAIKEGAETFLKRQYKTVAAGLSCCFWACCFPHSPVRRNMRAEAKPTWCCRICRA